MILRREATCGCFIHHRDDPWRLLTVVINSLDQCYVRSGLQNTYYEFRQCNLTTTFALLLDILVVRLLDVLNSLKHW